MVRSTTTTRPASSDAARSDKSLLADQAGTTTMEWALLLGFIALPSYFIITLALDTLVGYYQMIGLVTSLPLP